MIDINLPNNWIARTDQRPLWNYIQNNLYHGRAVLCAHRQYGKDTVGMHLLCSAMHQRIGNYWHMLPEASQSRKAIWEAINPDTGLLRIDEAFPKVIRKKTKDSEMKIDLLCGSSYQLVGSDNFNSLVGSMPVGILASEWALANPMALFYLDPMMRKNKGFIMFISTPRGRNHFQKLLQFGAKNESWFSQTLTANDTPVFSEQELKEIRKSYISLASSEEEGEAFFNQEYMCSFEGAILGSYYAKVMKKARDEGRITKVPYQPECEVNTYWDLGVDDSMTIWFAQHIGKGHHLIDYHSDTGMGLEHYAKILKDKKYNYGNHYMPHDANVREMTSGTIAKTRKEVGEQVGINPIEVVQRVQNMDIVINVHIPAVRNVIATCWFDEEKCFDGISALENYHAKYDKDKQVLSKRPDHDINSHGADAFRTLAVGYAPLTKTKTAAQYYKSKGI